MTAPLAIVSAQGPRRFFALAVLWALAGLLIWLALAQPPAPLWQIFLIALAGLAFWGAERLRKATLLRVELSEEGLTDSAGRVIAPMERIRRVERGAFAFKPSNGFLLVLDRSVGGRIWAPGLYWRMGRRVGVGGVTPSHQAKAMAEMIALQIASRDGD